MKILELKNEVTKIKQSVDGLKSRTEMTEKRISGFEDRRIGLETFQSKQNIENQL